MMIGRVLYRVDCVLCPDWPDVLYQGYHYSHLTSLYLLLTDWLILPERNLGQGRAHTALLSGKIQDCQLEYLFYRFLEEF